MDKLIFVFLSFLPISIFGQITEKGTSVIFQKKSDIVKWSEMIWTGRLDSLSVRGKGGNYYLSLQDFCSGLSCPHLFLFRQSGSSTNTHWKYLYDVEIPDTLKVQLRRVTRARFQPAAGEVRVVNGEGNVVLSVAKDSLNLSRANHFPFVEYSYLSSSMGENEMLIISGKLIDGERFSDTLRTVGEFSGHTLFKTLANDVLVCYLGTSGNLKKQIDPRNFKEKTTENSSSTDWYISVDVPRRIYRLDENGLLKYTFKIRQNSVNLKLVDPEGGYGKELQNIRFEIVEQGKHKSRR